MLAQETLSRDPVWGPCPGTLSGDPMFLIPVESAESKCQRPDQLTWFSHVLGWKITEPTLELRNHRPIQPMVSFCLKAFRACVTTCSADQCCLWTVSSLPGSLGPLLVGVSPAQQSVKLNIQTSVTDNENNFSVN